MSKTTIGWLKHGDLFKFENRVYRVGHCISNTNGYVACVDIHTHKTTRLYIDTTVEDMKGGCVLSKLDSKRIVLDPEKKTNKKNYEENINPESIK